MQILIIIIIFLIVLVSASMLLKKFFKYYLIFNLVIIIALLISGFFVYRDARDFRENFGISSNLVLLEEDNKVLTGFVLQKEPEILKEEEISQYSVYLADGDYEGLLGSNYKLMVVKLETVSKIEENMFRIDEQEFTKDELLGHLRSGDNPEYKAAIFSYLFSEYLASSANLLKEYKKGNIFIYPETIIFKILKLMPISLIEAALQRVS